MGSWKERIARRNLWITKNRADVASTWRRTRFKVFFRLEALSSNLTNNKLFWKIIWFLKGSPFYTKKSKSCEMKNSVFWKWLKLKRWIGKNRNSNCSSSSVRWIIYMTHLYDSCLNSAWRNIPTKWSNKSKWNLVRAQRPSRGRSSANWNCF